MENFRSENLILQLITSSVRWDTFSGCFPDKEIDSHEHQIL